MLIVAVVVVDICWLNGTNWLGGIFFLLVQLEEKEEKPTTSNGKTIPIYSIRYV